MRTGRGFRMILHREDRQFAMPESLHGTVIQVDVGNLELRNAGNSLLAPFDRETMILRRDQYPPGGEITHWMVPAAMAVRHLDRFRPVGETEDLVTEANSKDW